MPPSTQEATEARRDAPELSSVDFALTPHDVRRKRPPALSFVLRWETLRRVVRVVSLLAIDYAGIWLAIFVALSVKAAVLDDWVLGEQVAQTQEFVAFAYLITVLLFARAGLYGDRGSRPGLGAIVSSLFMVTLIALIFALADGQRFSSYYIFYGSLLFGTVIVGSLRLGFDHVIGVLLRAAGLRRRAVLVGRGEHIDGVAHALSDSPHSAVNVIGFVSLTPRPDNGLVSLGALEDLREILRVHRVDEVVVADPDFPEAQAVELVDVCHAQGVRVRIAPSTMELLVHRAEFVPGEAVPLFELKPPVFEGVDFVVKRTFDLVVSTLLLLVLAPLLAAIALAIRLSSRGPVIYRSVRPGIGGAPFHCFKFRTMFRDADQQQADLESLNEASGALFKIRPDPRMTPVGRLLRRYSLDELPQLVNVLRGEMSLVGPRPLPQRDFERLEPWHQKRYLVLPGITGLWQVSGRSELDFDDLVRLDFLYLERWSVFLDLSILLKTVPAVFTRRGAF